MGSTIRLTGTLMQPETTKGRISVVIRPTMRPSLRVTGDGRPGRLGILQLGVRANQTTRAESRITQPFLPSDLRDRRFGTISAPIPRRWGPRAESTIT